MLRIALGFSKNMHKYMLILCIFIHFFRNIMHKVDAYFSTSDISCQLNQGYRMVYELFCLDEKKIFVNFYHKGFCLTKKNIKKFFFIQT
jgi:hypothetical protein